MSLLDNGSNKLSSSGMESKKHTYYETNIMYIYILYTVYLKELNILYIFI